jgi:hypothetical protein
MCWAQQQVLLLVSLQLQVGRWGLLIQPMQRPQQQQGAGVLWGLAHQRMRQVWSTPLSSLGVQHQVRPPLQQQALPPLQHQVLPPLQQQEQQQQEQEQ